MLLSSWMSNNSLTSNRDFLPFAFKNMPKTTVTLKDIAQRLGLTIATVSKALKDYPDISPLTKASVRKLADEMHYSPNALALKLRKKKTFVLGVIIPEIVHHFFSNVISGIIDMAEERGYNVLLTQSDESMEREIKEAKLLLSQRVDGLLISLANNTDTVDHLKEFQEMEVPIVMFDKVNGSMGTSLVQVDDRNGAFLAVKHLIEGGRRRIAHIRGPIVPQTANERHKGYCDAIEEAGLKTNPEYIRVCKDVTQQEGEEFTRQLLLLPEPPDAIFCITDLVAIGAMKAIKDAGYRIPEDIALVGFSDWNIAAVVSPALTSVYQPGYEMGQQATRILVNEIEAKEAKLPVQHQSIVLKTELKIRASS